MGLLREATNQTAFAKIGIYGYQGSGKTYTGTNIAIGICTTLGEKQAAFIDTEVGSDFMIKRYSAAGIKLFVTKSRAFTDLLVVIRECVENKIPVLQIDSTTHFWRELCEAYKRKLRRRRLQFQDWDLIKTEWRQYTDLFNTSHLHIVACGRAGKMYKDIVDDDGGRDIVQTGDRFIAESEFGFEPNLVIKMEKITPTEEILAGNMKAKDKKRAVQKASTGSSSKFIHRAIVEKDRADMMNGEVIDNPKFEDFLPHFNDLNIGGEHFPIDTSRTSEDRFTENGSTEYRKDQRKKAVALEEIEAELVKAFPSTAGKDKKAKLLLLEYIFGTNSWTAIKDLGVELLKAGSLHIKKVLSMKDNIATIKKAESLDDLDALMDEPPDDDGAPKQEEGQPF